MAEWWELAATIVISAVAIGGIAFGYLLAEEELILLGVLGASAAVGIGYTMRHSQHSG